MYTQKDWERLGEALVNRRVELNEPKRAPFAKRNGFANDRVLFDLEKGRRDNYDMATLIQVERAYQWPKGAITRVLSGQSAIIGNYGGAEGGNLDDREITSTMRLGLFGSLSHLESATSAIASNDGHRALESIAYAQQELLDLVPMTFMIQAEITRTAERTDDVGGQDDYDLVADDADGYDHEDEDEGLQTDP